ncbi:MAG: F0F1 ATP synthase subunit B [Flavobacteriales bacterium]|nr:F0F1 ATP synthase subunit B [Flavobacteriales bacterium]MCZ2442377.1 F0F1 ATP synthase subunit B [Flavobacteriales bacterium]
MELLNPNVGLVFWMMISFLLLLALLRKFAWKPILSAIKSREESIHKALNAASEAEKKLSSLKSENEALLAQAKKERDEILKEAREAREHMISEAKEKAQQEAGLLLASAREGIQNEKMKAITDLRNQVAVLSIEIAERILKERLSDEHKQKEVMDSILKEVTLN